MFHSMLGSGKLLSGRGVGVTHFVILHTIVPTVVLPSGAPPADLLVERIVIVIYG